MVDRCEKEGIAYLPYFPLSAGNIDEKPELKTILKKCGDKMDATPTQVALAWLLKRSPAILPIPGTSSIAHLEENWAAGSIELPDELFEEINAATK
jgi:aryl-alcohol dehydrogenase-like predicted oxidoreductase